MKEDHGGEEGLLSEVINEKGNITKKDLTLRLKQIKNNPDFADEYQVPKEYLALSDKESAASKKLKETWKDLDTKVMTKYSRLSEDEIKTLVVEDKWLAELVEKVQSE